MKKIITILLAAIALNAHSQSFQPKETPELEFALQLKVTLGETYTIDNTQHGKRIVIPITGGTFEGPHLKGTIINGGADYQLSNGSRTELEAIYSIKTDVTEASLPMGKMPTANPLSTSRQLHSLRHLPTANTAG